MVSLTSTVASNSVILEEFADVRLKFRLPQKPKQFFKRQSKNQLKRSKTKLCIPQKSAER